MRLTLWTLYHGAVVVLCAVLVSSVGWIAALGWVAFLLTLWSSVAHLHRVNLLQLEVRYLEARQAVEDEHMEAMRKLWGMGAADAVELLDRLVAEQDGGHH